MQNFFDKFVDVFKNFTWISILEIALIAILIYFAFYTLKSNNAKMVIVYYSIFTVLTGIVIIALWCKTGLRGGAVFIILQAIFIVSVVVMFATEIKRTIWDRRHSDIKHGSVNSKSFDVNVCIDEIIKAVQNMSKNDIGAIIILSNGNLPNGVLESGVQLNSDISSQLIESIFFPKTALHDGAMVLYGTKIQAAGCFLPLAQEVNLSKDLGSRHRAGIGLTETVNVTAIIVSEETGIISIAKGGKIVRYVDSSVLRETLKLFFWKDIID